MPKLKVHNSPEVGGQIKSLPRPSRSRKYHEWKEDGPLVGGHVGDPGLEGLFAKKSQTIGPEHHEVSVWDALGVHDRVKG